MLCVENGCREEGEREALREGERKRREGGLSADLLTVHPCDHHGTMYLAAWSYIYKENETQITRLSIPSASRVNRSGLLLRRGGARGIFAPIRNSPPWECRKLIHVVHCWPHFFSWWIFFQCMSYSKCPSPKNNSRKCCHIYNVHGNGHWCRLTSSC